MATTKQFETATVEDIRALAARIKDNWSLCKLFAGTRRACEAEAMVAQTFHASVLNLDKGRGAFSFQGDGLRGRAGGGLFDNATAWGMLVERGYFVEDEHEGKPTIVITQRLVDLLKGHFAKQDAKAQP